MMISLDDELSNERESATARMRDLLSQRQHLKTQTKVAQKTIDNIDKRIARDRSFGVTWDTFIDLARDDSNWKCIPIDDPHEDCRMCKSGDACWYGGNRDRVGGLSILRFDTVDDDFDGWFTLCDVCLMNDCEEYVEWWLTDVGDDWKDDLQDHMLFVDPEHLGEAGKKTIELLSDVRKRRRIKV